MKFIILSVMLCQPTVGALFCKGDVTSRRDISINTLYLVSCEEQPYYFTGDINATGLDPAKAGMRMRGSKLTFSTGKVEYYEWPCSSVQRYLP